MANTLILIFLLLAPVVTHAYYKSIILEPAAEVVVKFQQQAGTDSNSSCHWGFCSLGDPAHPEAIALRELGANATALFILATDYPLRTYLDKTPLEYNLRFAVGQKLEEEARLAEDRRRLRESREKFMALLRELGLDLEDLEITNPVYAFLFQKLRNQPETEGQTPSHEDGASLGDNPGEFISDSPNVLQAGTSALSIKGVDIIRSSAFLGHNNFRFAMNSASQKSNADRPRHEIAGQQKASDVYWIDKAFDNGHGSS